MPAPRKPHKTKPYQLRMEPLEGREVPANLLGLTSTNSLVSFDSSTPGTVTNVAVTGLLAGENLVGVDFRPSNGVLYGVSDGSHLYTINATTGVATIVNPTAFTPAATGAAIGFDFNPAADLIRIVTSSNQNYRVNPTTGVTAGVDTAPAYDATSYADYFTGTAPTPNISAVAYTKNTDPATGKTITTLYDIDSKLDVISIQGSPNGNFYGGTDLSPNSGKLFISNALDFDATDSTTFTIVPTTDEAFIGNAGSLLSYNLTLGTTTKLGTIGTGSLSLKGLTVAPSATGAGTLSLSSNAYNFAAGRGPIAVTVNRTAGTTGTVSVNYSTSNGTATSPSDYFAASGTLTFADGITSQTFFLSLPGGDASVSPAENFTVTLSTPSTGAVLGTTTSALVTIPAVTTAPVATKFLAVGAGAGATPMVEILNATTGAKIGSFLAYESTFTGGVTVASGDVNGDGVQDVIVGAGQGGGPRIRVFNGTTLGSATPALLADFFAYESSFTGGVNIASGDVDGDGFEDLVVGAANGGGPRIRVFDGSTILTTQTTTADFFAYESSFRGGVNVGVGNFNNDGSDDIIAGAGIGGGPRVRVFDGKNVTTILTDYFAYDSSLRSGVTVAAGDLNGDRRVDVLTGSGPGGGPNVRAFSGLTETQLVNFFAYDSALRGGVRVASADLNDDGTDELVTGSGPGNTRVVNFYNATGTTVFSYNAFDATITGGVYVG
jgi:Domain of unknown function (DUF4394)/Calx-beta domain/FG-GAP-like repeat